MDSGIRLTSKSDLPVARYLDLKMERFISAVPPQHLYKLFNCYGASAQ
jgi:hypothetical protein